MRARLMSGAVVGVQALYLLRQCLAQLGATPADRAKMAVRDDGDEADDPEVRYFS